MEFATRALGTLLPKLAQLLHDEYNLHKSTKKNIKFLTTELECIQAALHSVDHVSREELSELVRIWARDAWELSYDMEDIVDTFLVRVQGTDCPRKKSRKKFIKKMMDFVTKARIRHDIGQDINDIKERVEEVARRRDRYKVDVATPVKTSIDPRIAALYNKATDLVGIDEASQELIMRLTKDDDKCAQQRIVSVVGFGGLGKTTLAKAVYDKIKGHFDCTAFVPVGRNPDLKKVFKDISIDLGMHIDFEILDVRQLIDKLREFLDDKRDSSGNVIQDAKRYFLVIDDVWEIESWEIIKLVFLESNKASRIMTTTRKQEVAGKAGEVYKLQPLSDDYSKKLFFARIFGAKCKPSYEHQPIDVSDKILRKCGGIPLAIITMASLLVGKPMDEWSEVHRSIDFANKENQQVENTEKILFLSYYDLPSHLRTCLLYLCMFPEDYFIEKSTLVWMWIAEGFVQGRQGMSSFDIGEGYFNELVNRSMIQLVKTEDWFEMECSGCQVHDMVLDLIRSISSEENFVTILGYNNELGGRVRRLALQNKKTSMADMDMQLVRSFISWRWGIDNDKGISLPSFKLVRVLALHNISNSSNQHHRLQVPLRNLLHLRYLRLCGGSIVIPAKEMATLKFLQTLDVGEAGNSMMIDQVVITSLGLLTKLLCLRLRGPVSIVPDVIGKLTSLEELNIYYIGEKELWRRFVNVLCGLRDLRVLRLGGIPQLLTTDMVLQLLRNLQKLEILSLTMFSSLVSADTAAWEAEGFLLSRRFRQLLLSRIRFSRFPSFCINPSCLPHLSHLSLRVDAIDEQDLRILGGLPQLCFLELGVDSITEVDCNSTRTDDDGCLFPKLRRCSICFHEGVRFLLPSQEDSSSVSFCMWHVKASMLLGSEREDAICKAAGFAPTLMPSAQELWFMVYVQEFIKDGNHDNDCVSLGLEYFASLQTVHVHIYCDGDSSAAEVEAALHRAADVHPNRPTLEVKMSSLFENKVIKVAL